LTERYVKMNEELKQTKVSMSFVCHFCLTSLV